LTSFDANNKWLIGTNGLAALNVNATTDTTNTNVIQALPSTEVPNLIAWVRGQDMTPASTSTSGSTGSSGSGNGNGNGKNNGSSGSGTTTTTTTTMAGAEAELGPGAPVTVRSSIHADVLHSRPAVVNYGGSIGVVVYYGTNDGVFHAVNGNRTQGIGATRAGGEIWASSRPSSSASSIVSTRTRRKSSSPPRRLASRRRRCRGTTSSMAVRRSCRISAIQATRTS
jgi:type IV pilus assembly protein PilY1